MSDHHRSCRRHSDSVHRPVRIFPSKEVGVSAGSFQKKLIFRKFVDENPVGFYVAVAPSDPISPEFVVAIFWRQRFPGNKQVNDSFYFFEVFAPLPHAFDILFELLCLGEIHSSHEA
jgi:hypothetical protein